MASAVQIPLAEYLETVYGPDLEYIVGELKKRNVGKKDHARMQYLLAALLASLEVQCGVVGGTEWRLQVSANRVRVPDLCWYRPEK